MIYEKNNGILYNGSSNCEDSDGKSFYGTEINFSETEMSIFISIHSIGGAIGSLLSSPIQNRLGRKTAMILSVIPEIIGWFIIGEHYLKKIDNIS